MIFLIYVYNFRLTSDRNIPITGISETESALEISLTPHAMQRSVKRSIPARVIDQIYAYGSVRRSRGADSYFIDHAALREVADDLGSDAARHLERHRDVYLIVSDRQKVITVARSQQRFRR